MLTDPRTFHHAAYRWDDQRAAALDPLARLVYHSNLLGAAGRITNSGGGNTAAKIMAIDPLSGEQLDVLRVKGSGGYLRTAKRESFSALYMDRLIGLQAHHHHAPVRGPKTQIEDDIVALYSHATFNLNPGRGDLPALKRGCARPPARSSRATVACTRHSCASERQRGVTDRVVS